MQKGIMVQYVGACLAASATWTLTGGGNLSDEAVHFEIGEPRARSPPKVKCRS